MGRPRHQIEKHAKAEFAIAQEHISLKHAEKQRRVLAEIARHGNIGGYLPALTTLGEKHVRKQILALADAYARAFTLFGLPCDVEAEKSLEVGAKFRGSVQGPGAVKFVGRPLARINGKTSGVASFCPGTNTLYTKLTVFHRLLW